MSFWTFINSWIQSVDNKYKQEEEMVEVARRRAHLAKNSKAFLKKVDAEYDSAFKDAVTAIKPQTFSHEAWDALLASSIEQIKSLVTVKGGEYAGDSDRLANFRRNGQVLGLPMEVVWSIYYAKHHDAVMQYVKDLSAGTTRPRAEPLSGRVDDMIVYLLLLKAIFIERGEA